MSRYLIEQYQPLVAYTPGEQPRDMQYVKLNTNESPFPPSPAVVKAAAAEAARLQLYSDPESTEVTRAVAGKIARFAEKEGLSGHARSALIRFEED